MKLYEIPKGSKIYSDLSDEIYLIFYHLDGLYSYCETEKGAVINLAGNTPLEIYKDGYKIALSKE